MASNLQSIPAEGESFSGEALAKTDPSGFLVPNLTSANLTAQRANPKSNSADGSNVAIQANQPRPTHPEAEFSKPHSVTLASSVLISFGDKVKYANSLARRGAISSALAELKSSLRLLSEAIDQANQTQQHSRALQEAFVALDEVSDLAGWSHELSVLVDGHETDVLTGKDLEQVTFHQARLAYFGHAGKTVSPRLRRRSNGGKRISFVGESFPDAERVFSAIRIISSQSHADVSDRGPR